jgi:hypothetical protein
MHRSGQAAGFTYTGCTKQEKAANSLRTAYSGNFVGRSVKLLLAFASTVIPGFILLEIHDQDFCFLLDMYVYMFRNGASFSKKEVSLYVGATFVAP